MYPPLSSLTSELKCVHNNWHLLQKIIESLELSYPRYDNKLQPCVYELLWKYSLYNPKESDAFQMFHILLEILRRYCTVYLWSNAVFINSLPFQMVQRLFSKYSPGWFILSLSEDFGLKADGSSLF